MLECNDEFVDLKRNGVEYKVKVPSVDEGRTYTKNVAKAEKEEKDTVEFMFDFLEVLGLPKDVSDKLTGPQLAELMGELTKVKK